MQIHWTKLVLGAIAAEIAAILLLVCLVAAFSPNEAQAAHTHAEKLGRWVGPGAGSLFSFVGALWIARPLRSGQLLHGILFGCMLAFIDVLILVLMRAPFEWIFVASNVGKIAAGILGGLASGYLSRRHEQPNA
jgi:hypothetical protein